MQIAEIKRLVEVYSLAELALAEEAILEERKPEIEINGDDEGEMLTHVMAASWIKADMEKNGSDIRTSLRNYTQKVRKSIS
ncbi:MAG: hypothetical protein K1X82_02045 [Bacteroidia bacterium]|nr:hypothetical protein [Bacteroidia bacterium]